MLSRAEGMHPVYALTEDEQRLFVAAAPIILPRFGFGGQIPATTQAVVVFGSVAGAVAALATSRYWFAGVLLSIALLALRTLSFYGRNEALNRRRAALLYVVARKRTHVGELELGVIEDMYADALDFAEIAHDTAAV
ncbi:MAG: hypothetical protein M3Z54_01600 [Gemmatimonadota bacterium]|nr:hypothetical protein [Gemmatimonadota bacterium]